MVAAAQLIRIFRHVVESAREIVQCVGEVFSHHDSAHLDLELGLTLLQQESDAIVELAGTQTQHQCDCLAEAPHGLQPNPLLHDSSDVHLVDCACVKLVGTIAELLREIFDNLHEGTCFRSEARTALDSIMKGVAWCFG